MITMMAGVILLVMAFTGLGTAVKFIPRLRAYAAAIGTIDGATVALAAASLLQGPFLFGTTREPGRRDEGPVEVRAGRGPAAAQHDGHRRHRAPCARATRGSSEGSGRTLLLCGALPQPSTMLHRSDFVAHVGEDNILTDINAALARAAVVFNSPRQSA